MGSKLEDMARILNKTRDTSLFDSIVSELKNNTNYLPEKEIYMLKFFRIYKALFLFNFFLEQNNIEKAKAKLKLALALLESEDSFTKL